MLQSGSQWSPLVCLALAGLQPGALKQLVKSPPRATNRALHVCSCLMHIQLILDAALDNTYVVIISIILKQFYNIPVGNSAWWFFSSCSVSSLLSSCVYKRSVGRDTPFPPDRRCQESAVRYVWGTETEKWIRMSETERWTIPTPPCSPAAAPMDVPKTSSHILPQKLRQSFFAFSLFLGWWHICKRGQGSEEEIFFTGRIFFFKFPFQI